MTYIGIIITFVFINNFILTQFLGLCPFIGVSRNVDSAVGMGFAVTFVMSIASLTTWAIYHWLLIPLNLGFLQTITFILVIAALVQLVEMVIQKISPPLYKALGIYLPLITTNCAILGVTLLNLDMKLNFIESVVQGFASGIGFTLALVLMASIRERLELADVPRSMRGLPIAFITAGLMSIAFLGFSGLKIR